MVTVHGNRPRLRQACHMMLSPAPSCRCGNAPHPFRSIYAFIYFHRDRPYVKARWCCLFRSSLSTAIPPSLPPSPLGRLLGIFSYRYNCFLFYFCQAAYSKVQYWTRNVDLFSKKFVFVPVVENMHWSLACIANLDNVKVRYTILSHLSLCYITTFLLFVLSHFCSIITFMLYYHIYAL